MSYLIDLERSIASGRVYYWKPNRRGYTTNIEEAGLYQTEIAEQIVQGDIDNVTRMVAAETVLRILKNE